MKPSAQRCTSGCATFTLIEAPRPFLSSERHRLPEPLTITDVVFFIEHSAGQDLSHAIGIAESRQTERVVGTHGRG